MIDDDIAAVWQCLAATDTGTIACVFDIQLIGLVPLVNVSLVSAHNGERLAHIHIDAGENIPVARQIVDA